MLSGPGDLHFFCLLMALQTSSTRIYWLQESVAKETLSKNKSRDLSSIFIGAGTMGHGWARAPPLLVGGLSKYTFKTFFGASRRKSAPPLSEPFRCLCSLVQWPLQMRTTRPATRTPKAQHSSGVYHPPYILMHICVLGSRLPVLAIGPAIFKSHSVTTHR